MYLYVISDMCTCLFTIFNQLRKRKDLGEHSPHGRIAASVLLRKCEVCYKPPMKVIDRTKAVTQHFLENSFKKLSIKRKQKQKNPKNTKIYVF